MAKRSFLEVLSFSRYLAYISRVCQSESYLHKKLDDGLVIPLQPVLRYRERHPELLFLHGRLHNNKPRFLHLFVQKVLLSRLPFSRVEFFGHKKKHSAVFPSTTEYVKTKKGAFFPRGPAAAQKHITEKTRRSPLCLLLCFSLRMATTQRKKIYGSI